MASALQPEIWRPNMPGVRELVSYSKGLSKPLECEMQAPCTLVVDYGGPEGHSR